ncbi:hypothetical protein ACFSTD_05245 [Novosphingobium colocasiae]|uniref:Uncharacterized protein n=1 Tax=Novosphingobium colocasiae TaxID=1256513 RepID=A0A918PFH5_9SPHN|nr:hypothetical protein GCM10011614_18250 [Novosphingobium colocasiae]
MRITVMTWDFYLASEQRPSDCFHFTRNAGANITRYHRRAGYARRPHDAPASACYQEVRCVP